VSILIERRLGTAPFWMPVEKGWVDPGVQVEIIESPSAATLRAHSRLAIVDSLLASTALDSSVIAREHCVMMDQISLLTMVTADRPDEIERATVSTPGISLTGRALAEIVIPSFYGIEIAGWSNEAAGAGPNSILITEDAAALLPTDDEAHYHEDLGRAWFLLTNTPFVSHVCIAPEAVYAGDPEALREVSQALDRIVASAEEQRRMLRRNISGDHGIDRDLVVDVFDALKLRLSDAGIEGLKTLYHRSGVLSRTGPIDGRFVSLAP
jgi:predicted solute-binding protein